MRLLPLLVALAACKGNASFVWLEGTSYRWVGANHRVSHIEFSVDEEAAKASVIGGTSTTREEPDLDATCDPELCEEIPFQDMVDVVLDWGRVDDPDVTSANGQIELTADADGEMAVLKLPLARRASKGPATAIIRGYRISTDHPVDGDPSCYNPDFGWLPTRMAIELSEPRIEGREATVEVFAHFAAGKTLEDFRVCIDEVNDRARVRVTVDVQVIAGGEATGSADVVGAATYTYGDGPMNPDLQELPPAVPIDLKVRDAAVGWSKVDWAFHVDDADGRGAYLRSIDLRLDSEEALGGATNYSPLTQLSGFDYQFNGTVVGHEVGGTISRGSFEDQLPVELDGEGDAVVHELGRTD